MAAPRGSPSPDNPSTPELTYLPGEPGGEMPEERGLLDDADAAAQSRCGADDVFHDPRHVLHVQIGVHPSRNRGPDQFQRRVIVEPVSGPAGPSRYRLAARTPPSM